ncbi:FAD-dependent oxidoreductase [Aquihabitans sp. McL0605]|uniref:FAD-dependent oxidoreductase n=1 Tax=Aquihabitans sp. McL0605 TaxID=3415671 RepID=UPI003CF10FE9
MSDALADPIPPLAVDDLEDGWSDEADVIVVGLGAAGLATSIEAAERGADVIALDRSGGGGTSANAGGILYLGGGTATQLGAGVSDTPSEMRAFLADALGRPADDPRLTAYCAGSIDHHDWLVRHGVAFEPVFWDEPGMEPPGTEGLIYSGGEDANPYRQQHRPVARGHVPATPNAAGWFLVERLRDALERTSARVLTDHRAERLVVDGDQVVGVTVRVDGELHALRARRGVVLASGGWAYNEALLAEHTPLLLEIGWRLGTDADDGWALRVTQGLGAAIEGMDAMEVAVPITPPRTVVRGVIVNRHGERFINEDTYFGHLGQTILTEQDGVAWLLFDEPRYVVNRMGMRAENVCETWSELAEEIGLPPARLAETMAAYNEAAAHGEDRQFAKASEWVVPLTEAPFGAIDLRVATILYAGFPLGGTVTDDHARVVRQDGTTVPGLYAAGRAAGSLALERYCSGISLGEGTFFGRRAATAMLPQ